MKKFFAAILCVCCIAAFTAGCGYTDALTSQQSSTQETTVSTDDEAKSEAKDSDYPDTFEGLCNYFTAKGYIPEETDSNKPVKMDYSLIGAKEGQKYTTTFDGKTIIIELYVYDTKNLNDKANEIIDSVKKDGTFTILDLPSVDAYLSDNGKYLMIYTDESIDKENPDKDSNTYIHREEVIESFKSFHNF